jgi:nicotinate-nucleotide adenylyltransferase
MRFYQRKNSMARVVAAFPGSYHPVTSAHVAVAWAALRVADEVVFTMPRAFPHKSYEKVGLEERLALVGQAVQSEPRFSTAVAEGGLFIDIARECREAYGPQTEIHLLCGTDAAERIVNWDYGDGACIAQMLEEFQMLVAARGGEYRPPAELAARIHTLAMDDDWSHVSATEVRQRIQLGLHWRELVPEAVQAEVLRLYS